MVRHIGGDWAGGKGSRGGILFWTVFFGGDRVKKDLGKPQDQGEDSVLRQDGHWSRLPIRWCQTQGSKKDFRNVVVRLEIKSLS